MGRLVDLLTQSVNLEMRLKIVQIAPLMLEPTGTRNEQLISRLLILQVKTKLWTEYI